MTLKKTQRTYLVGMERSKVRKGGHVLSFLSLWSGNAKTGISAQLWILDADYDPQTSYAFGTPANCPAECPFIDGGDCYVTKWRASAGIYRAYLRGSIPSLTPAQYRDAFRLAKAKGSTFLRFGADGDPAAVNPKMLRALKAAAVAEGIGGHTGYTHAHARPTVAPLADLLMASADDVVTARAARRRGWRTFRVASSPSDDGHEPGEVRCPASAERGHVATCATCGTCDGTSGSGPAGIVIRGHGAGFFGTAWEV